MDGSSILIFAVALIIAAGSPGPSIAALVAQVLARGPRSVLGFLLAMWIGEGVWLSLAVLGLAIVAQTFQVAFVAIKYLGVAYLLYLAWRMWFTSSIIRAEARPTEHHFVRLFLAGLAITLGNPKIMLFYMALVPSIVNLADVDLLGWGKLIITMLAVLIAVDLAWVILAAQARRLLRSARAVRAANRTGAGILAGAAAAIATR